jgi:cation diffusion facilitator family transporter
MIKLLIRFFIQNSEQTDAPEVREKYGILSGIVGIFFNILLFSLKFFAGLLSGAISIIADAFNNLSDAGSSIITMIGFRISTQEADSDHPFGHGRSEYIAGLIVSIIILIMAFELIHSSFMKILHPEPVSFTPIVLLILAVSILVKLYMYCYNTYISKKIASAALRATATDSFSDCLATSAVLLAMLVSHFLSVNIDGYCGILVGLFILWGGIQAARDTISPLLGQAPDPKFIQNIKSIVAQYPEVLGTHDLIVHDYGPGRRMISLHAEVPAKGDILKLHDTIDNIERRLQKELCCSAVIHMDPIMNDDAETLECQELVKGILAEIDPALSLHDFRIVKGPTHTNLIFDLVVPYQTPYTIDALKDAVKKKLQEKNAQYFAVIQIDHP